MTTPISNLGIKYDLNPQVNPMINSRVAPPPAPPVSVPMPPVVPVHVGSGFVAGVVTQGPAAGSSAVVGPGFFQAHAQFTKPF